jgi:LacI family transcriptional regulator
MDSNIHIPEQIAVIGVDDDPVVRLPISLSSVRHDLEGMAYRAAELLDELMDDRKPIFQKSKVHPKGVVTRQSTDITVIQDPRVLKGIEYIRANFPRSALSVERVASAVGVSRRSLEKAFRAEMCRSVLQEIIRTRTSQAKLLLATTDLPVADVAARSVFANLNHFSVSSGNKPNPPPEDTAWREDQRTYNRLVFKGTFEVVYSSEEERSLKLA